MVGVTEIMSLVSGVVSGVVFAVKGGYNVYSIIPGFKELKESVDDYLNYLSAFKTELANLKSAEDSIQEPLRLLKEQVETSLSPFSEWQEKSDGHKLWTSNSVKRQMGRSEKQINRYLNIFFCSALGRRNEKQITGKTEELKDNHHETVGREESLELKKPKEMEKRKPRFPLWKRIVNKSSERWRSFLSKRTKKKTEVKNIHHEMVTDTSQKIQEQKRYVEEYKQLLKQEFTLDWVTTHLGDGKEALKSWDEAVPLLQKHRRFQRLSENLRQVTWLNHVERLRVKVAKQEKGKNKPKQEEGKNKPKQEEENQLAIFRS